MVKTEWHKEIARVSCEWRNYENMKFIYLCIKIMIVLKMTLCWTVIMSQL